MTYFHRSAWAIACAAFLAIPATGLAASATIRVEGAGSTLLSERAANIPVAGSATLVDSFTGVSNTVSNQSATSLLVRARSDKIANTAAVTDIHIGRATQTLP